MSKKKRKTPRKMAQSPVSLGATVRENLPLPIVYYPNHYGTFFAFARDDYSSPVLCACAQSAVNNLMRLESLFGESPSSVHRLEPLYFPEAISSLSIDASEELASKLRFESGICHRCNLVAPSWRYSHEMYGTKFIQSYGWYVNQAYFRVGVYPPIARPGLALKYLPDACPDDYQAAIAAIRKAERAYQDEYRWFSDHAYDQGVSFDEIANRQERLRKAEGTRRRATRAFTKKFENIVREEFGFRKVGEGWVSETLLYQIVHRLFEDSEVLRHHRPDWLEGLELDIFLPSQRLAFEYQGQQHYHPVKAWGGQKALEELQARDARKADICEQLGIELVTVDYTEPLTEDHIRKVLQERWG
jgi:hypothetical protein